MTFPLNNTDRWPAGTCVVVLANGERIEWPADIRAALFDSIEKRAEWHVQRDASGSEIAVHMPSVAAILTRP